MQMELLEGESRRQTTFLLAAQQRKKKYKLDNGGSCGGVNWGNNSAGTGKILHEEKYLMEG